MTQATENGLAIDIQQLQFSYGKTLSNVIDIDSWQLASGDNCFLYGASGSGKTTLLNLLGGVLKPQQGQINLLGQNFSAMSATKKDKFRARHLGMVFQQFNLVPYLSVLENIELAAYFAPENKENSADRAVELMESMHLPTSLLSQRADSLSVGQQQRVAIARALVNHPEIIIADEPSSALDSDSRDSFMKLLLEIVAENGASLIFVSHDRGLKQFFSQQVDLTSLNRATINSGVTDEA